MRRESRVPAPIHDYGSRRLYRAALCGLIASIVAGPALSGGADISTDALRSDRVVLSTVDGAHLDINNDGNSPI